jgi:hypothetical protein
LLLKPATLTVGSHGDKAQNRPEKLPFLALRLPLFGARKHGDRKEPKPPGFGCIEENLQNQRIAMNGEEKPEQTQPDEDVYMTIKQLAKKIGVAESTMRRYLDELDVPRIIMGHQIVRIHYPTAKAYLERSPKHNKRK